MTNTETLTIATKATTPSQASYRPHSNFSIHTTNPKEESCPHTNTQTRCSRTLSLPGAITEPDIQAQQLKEYASESLTDPPDDLHSPTDSHSSDQSSQSANHSAPSNNSKDPDYPHPQSTLSSIRVLDIERELSLTCVQADQLHHVMRSQMLVAGLLGNIKFSPDNRADSEGVLKPILTIVKQALPILDSNTKNGVGAQRL